MSTQHIRVIARLDIKGPNLVKGIHLEGLRVLGKPEDFARAYYAQGADELLYQDAVASLYGRNSLLDIVRRTSEEIFIPLTVGGGLRSSDDIRAVLRAGADKVALNTAAIRRPELIREAAQTFGSSTIVVSIEAVRKPDGRYEALIDYGREQTDVDAVEWAQRAEALGAGELLVTSIDREGTGTGFDLGLTRQIADLVSIPVIACGGAGRSAHVCEVIQEARVDAVCVASLLHYHAGQRTSPSGAAYAAEGNIRYLTERRDFSVVEPCTLVELKAALAAAGIACRPSVSIAQRAAQ